MNQIQTLQQLIDSAEKPKFILEDKDRMTARLDLYFEKQGEDPIQSNSVYDALLPRTEDGAYKRKLVVGLDWINLDLGWVENVSHILINNIGRTFSVNPEPEVLEKEKQKSIIIRQDEVEFALIPQKQFLLIKPIDVSKLEMKCLIEETKIELLIIPE
jgi:hypothetical protein